MPKKAIEPNAQKVTGLIYDGDQLYHHGSPVEASPITTVLQDFSDFLGDSPTVLYGHNIKSFDCHVLLNTAKACDQLDSFQAKIKGFVDTLPLFKLVYPGLPTYKQTELYSRFVGESYQAHDALADVRALQRLVQNACDEKYFSQVSHTWQYILDVQSQTKLRNQLEGSWGPLVEDKTISKTMSQKAASSGLGVQHLCLAFRRGGCEAVKAVLSELRPDGHVRVTAGKRVLERIAVRISELE